MCECENAARDAHFPTHRSDGRRVVHLKKINGRRAIWSWSSEWWNKLYIIFHLTSQKHKHRTRESERAKGGLRRAARGQTTILPPALRGQLKFLWKLDCKFILLREQYNLQSYIIIIGQRAASWKIRCVNYKFERNNSPAGDIYCNFTPITRVQVWYYFIFILAILFLRIARE